MIRIYLAECDKTSEHDIGAALARYALYDTYTRTAPLKKDSRGKPYFDGTSIHVSISHSNGMCLAAVSDSEIGADIELIKGSEQHLACLAKRFFTEEESEYVSHSPADRFFRVWCAKESYIKYTGEGFSRPLNSFSVLEYEMCFSHFEYNGYHVAVCAKEYTDTPPTFVGSDKLENYH